MRTISVRLSDIAQEDRLTIKLEASASQGLDFLGLEQIAENTGEIISYSSSTSEGTSNSFQFDTRHVLYGKLRPYLNKVAIPEIAGRCSTEIIPLIPKSVSRDFLSFLLRTPKVVAAAMREKTGSRMPRANMSAVLSVPFDIPVSNSKQNRIVQQLKKQFSTISEARKALNGQLSELSILTNNIISQSIDLNASRPISMNSVLDEVKQGIGETWRDYRVLGATRDGLALAKEPPGKTPQRYKPVTHGTVFYNPMRIMIGSIAFVDEDDEPGITSPDYVVLKGKEGVVDSRWFYYWLRSPLGEACIQSLVRGAVRERMLFSRLAEGEIKLPDYKTQFKASKALVEIKPMQTAIENQIKELELIPQKLLAQTFEN